MFGQVPLSFFSIGVSFSKTLYVISIVSSRHTIMVTTNKNQQHTEVEKMFIEAFNLHSDALFRYCFFRVGDRERALEMTQDIFMKTWGHIQKNSTPILNIKAFLYTTGRNLIIDEYRKRKIVLSLETLEDEKGFEPSVDDYQSMVNIMDGSQAIALISSLPDVYREVIFMRYVQELSLEEIAQITGDSENAISVRIHRGIHKLQELFNHTKKT